MSVSIETSYPSLVRFALDVTESILEPFKGSSSVTNASWQKVVIRKIDALGNVYKLRNEHGQVTNQEARFTYTLHTPSQDLYLSDDKPTLFFKCALIFTFSQAIMTLNALWYVARVISDTTKSIFAALCSKLPLQERAVRLWQDITCRMKENIFKIVTVPIVLLGVKIGALIGLVSPFSGRRVVAKVEDLYNLTRGVKASGCSMNDSGSSPKYDVFYIAMCFQPRGSLLDEGKYIIDARLPA